MSLLGTPRCSATTDGPGAPREPLGLRGPLAGFVPPRDWAEHAGMGTRLDLRDVGMGEYGDLTTVDADGGDAPIGGASGRPARPGAPPSCLAAQGVVRFQDQTERSDLLPAPAA